MKCDFRLGHWSMDGLTHAMSVRFAPMPEFAQREDYIENLPTPASEDGFAYVSLVTKEKLKPNVKISCHCAFEDLAAPLLVLAKDLKEKDGRLYYGDYQEAVLWKNGINVWNLWTDASGTTHIRNLLTLEMPVEQGVVHAFSLEVQKDRFVVTLNGRSLSLFCDDIFESFHFGLTGCEGPCRFYDMEITEC